MSDQGKNKQKNSEPSQADVKDQANTTASGSQSGQRKAKVKTGEEAAADAAATAGQEAKDVASDVAGKAKKSASDTAARLRDAVEEQKAAGAERAKGIAGAINRAADELDDEIPEAAHYVRRAAEELEHLSDEVRERDAGELLRMAQDFARRQPTIVLGATALVGFAAVRFFMTSAQPRQVSTISSDRGPDQARPSPATQAGRSTKPNSDDAQAHHANATPPTSPTEASNAPGSSTSSGDPSGLSSQAPGFEPKASGSNSDEA